MDREDLLMTRRTVYEEYKDRVRLGEFDANSQSILVALKGIVELCNHLLEEARKKK